MLCGGTLPALGPAALGANPRGAAVFNKGWGVLDGRLVFLVAVPFTLWPGGQDLGALAGALGKLAQELNSAWAMLLGIAQARLGGLLATRGERSHAAGGTLATHRPAQGRWRRLRRVWGRG